MKIIFLIIVVLATITSFMVIVYSEPELFGLTKPHSRVGSYDGPASEMALIISEQCLDQEQNPFRDYAFAKTSNGHYYIDNVICERINVQQGGCLEPFSKGYPDETCKNRVTFDYPYGKTGPKINKEFCNQVELEPPIPTNTEENKPLHSEYLHICTIRGLIDNKQTFFQDEFESPLPPCTSTRTACFNTDANLCDPSGWECNGAEGVFEEIVE